jgi:hypothetical protein
MNRVPIAVENNASQCHVIQERITNFINVILNPSLFVFNEDNSWPGIDEPLGTWFNVAVSNLAKKADGEPGAVTVLRGFPLGPWRVAHDIKFTDVEMEACSLGEVDYEGAVMPARIVRQSYEGPRFAFFAQTDLQKELEEGHVPQLVSHYFYVTML